MIRLTCAFVMASLLAACAHDPHADRPCGELVVFQQPPKRADLHKLVITRINDKAVISQPSYRFKPGQYQLQLMEFIDDPRLAVALKERSYREMTLEVVADQRYHLAAQVQADALAEPEGYWLPVVWKQFGAACQFASEP
ncbi:hypothetical protein [Ferrimonas pelagia]|uniref:Lipoprotein n=1 Tax=Ferrimonas pelagia TaxID=1177826 RepID=A0ABP9EK70_9GAMM